ncbi:MAG: J domain-containing protein [Mesorhizobium sp.]|uniref:J domain-containing protein n=1 Tax=Mesorhizobium sp. TaxID=1871066 RepID=UPI001228959E|nr:J domain-containing protein [Mesorhizobium sp.]TJV51104.1 MAG: J domain-containing protein [Mesorhizobium sp.]
MEAQAFPLTWPDTMPRTPNKVTSKFKTGLSAALKNVRSSLELFAGDSGKKVVNLVISSNVTLGVERPADPGVAVWFVWDGMQVCIAVDRYPKVEDNLQAIHHIVEARRTEMRHGGLHIVRATFRGFTALPAPKRRSWREIFEFVTSGPITADNVENAYRRLAKKAHPDAPGGSHDAMAELNQAKEQALKEIGA